MKSLLSNIIPTKNTSSKQLFYATEKLLYYVVKSNICKILTNKSNVTNNNNVSLPLNGKTMQQHLETIIVPCEDEVKPNGGIKRKFKLRRMNHHLHYRVSNYHRNIMIHHTKFLLLVMWIICIFMPYGRSLTIFHCVYSNFDENANDIIHISFSVSMQF